MDAKFNAIIFFAITGIAVICLSSMFFVNATGEYVSWSSFYQPKDGMCYCHQGIGTYRSSAAGSGFATNCLSGIQGAGTKRVGIVTHNECIESCGPTNYWWCSN